MTQNGEILRLCFEEVEGSANYFKDQENNAKKDFRVY